MKSIVLSVAFCALTAGLAVGQTESIQISTSDGTVNLPVTVIAGEGENVARAASDDAPEPDGVMVLPVPGSDYALRTEYSESGRDVTWMLRSPTANAKSPFAESLCTSRWNAGEKGEHSFVSAMNEGESIGDWSLRHDDGLFMISTVYPMPGSSRRSKQDDSIEASTRDRAMTEWTDDQGVQHAVYTKMRVGEERDAWLMRHREVVEAFAEIRQPAG
jgi:hypothetical protein